MFNFIYKTIDFAHKLDKPSSPTEEYYKHIHTFCEILYLVRGNVKYTVESQTRQLEEGDIVFISSGKYHFATVDLNVAYERYVLKFPESVLPEFMQGKLAEGGAFYTNGKKFDVIFKLLDTYDESYTDEERYTLFLCELIKLTTLLCHEPSQPINKHDDFINRIIDYIHANIRNPITMNTLTDEFHYSMSFISTEFKKRMKISIMQYVRINKLIGAHQMILNGMKKSEAAEMFGFENYSTFYRAYKQLMQHNGEL